MKGKILTSVILWLGVMTYQSLQASVLMPDEALTRLAQSTNHRGLRHTLELNLQPVLTVNDANGMPALYVFGNESMGFAVVSADDCAVPLLGYSDAGEFNTAEMAPQMQSWLEGYAFTIGEARKGGSQIEYRLQSAGTDNGSPIEPLLKTTWNQTYPYNLQCPMVSGRRSVTGCVATAMAQVMNYWQYPRVGKGETSITADDEVLTLNFAEQEFKWDLMLDSYQMNSPQQSIDAVAYLMKACGYAIKMTYTSSESSAAVSMVPSVMQTYFGYDNEMGVAERTSYLTQEGWNSMIYNQLKTVGPVLYAGSVPGVSKGHCFVCDGYDGNGYFHINWGWGGMSDGYFLLNALNPSSQGTGGTAGGYNSFQVVVTGFQPSLGRISNGKIWIGNAASDSGNVQGQGYVYRINNPRNLELNVQCTAVGGYLSTPLTVNVNEAGTGTILTKEFGERVMLEAGETGIYTTNISLPQFDPTKTYSVSVAYELKGETKYFDTIRFAASSGVEGIEADLSGCWTVYNLSGLRVLVTDSKDDLNSLPSGFYIINGRKALVGN